MRNPGIRRLQALRDAALREAMQAALDRPDDDLRGKIERIEAYDRLLAAAPRRRWRELGWAMAVAVICVSLLGAGLSIRVPATRIVLEVTAGTSTLALIEPWQFNDSAAVQTPSLFLRELEEVELPAAVEVSQPLQKNAWASFEGGRVAVSELSVGAGSILTFEAGPARHVDLYVSGGSLAGTVTLTGSQRAHRRARRLRSKHRRRGGLPNSRDRQLPIRQPRRRSGAFADRAHRPDRAL